eukprot:scaffold307242_cov81-Attheya_sp.AAC.1
MSSDDITSSPVECDMLKGTITRESCKEGRLANKVAEKVAEKEADRAGEQQSKSNRVRSTRRA